jgi:hypothetical protein
MRADTTLIPDLTRAARCYRRGDYADAASALNGCLQEIGALLSPGALDAALFSKVRYSLETIYLMQQQEDWVAVADIIEYELIGLLASSAAIDPGSEMHPA